MKAYILSEEHGTVQIGSIVYQPCTGTMFQADRKSLKNKNYIVVEKASMEIARKILQKTFSWNQDNTLIIEIENVGLEGNEALEKIRKDSKKRR